MARENLMAYTQLEQQIGKIDVAQNKLRMTLNGVDGLINDIVGSGEGVFDTDAADKFKKKWDLFQEKFATYIKAYETQKNTIHKASLRTQQADEQAGQSSGTINL